MITVEYDGKTNTYYGLSKDTKPVDSAVRNGSIFIEIDTGNVYFFDEENHEWKEI